MRTGVINNPSQNNYMHPSSNAHSIPNIHSVPNNPSQQYYHTYQLNN
jgi:hypothetical protein